METNGTSRITIESVIKAPPDQVWRLWTTPDDIIKWNAASPDWHTTKAENDLRNGGRFLSRMEAKDGSFGFDFEGIYDEVKTNELISYAMSDGRSVQVYFEANGNETKVTETFEPETQNPIEMQRQGWQAILNNFKKYVEENDR